LRCRAAPHTFEMKKNDNVVEVQNVMSDDVVN
jgi:hypothetical protein